MNIVFQVQGILGLVSHIYTLHKNKTRTNFSLKLHIAI